MEAIGQVVAAFGDVMKDDKGAQVAALGVEGTILLARGVMKVGTLLDIWKAEEGVQGEGGNRQRHLLLLRENAGARMRRIGPALVEHGCGALCFHTTL
jgi:hypothetical protein